jgi:hypothetical protein
VLPQKLQSCSDLSSGEVPEELIYELTIFYDSQTSELLEDEVNQSLSEALMTPIRHRLSSLGLDRSSADHRGVILDFD